MSRGLTLKQAAEHCGLSVSGFRAWLRDGLVPGPWPKTRRYDLKALDAALDRMSGVTEDKPSDPVEEWRAKYEGTGAAR